MAWIPECSIHFTSGLLVVLIELYSGFGPTGLRLHGLRWTLDNGRFPTVGFTAQLIWGICS